MMGRVLVCALLMLAMARPVSAAEPSLMRVVVVPSAGQLSLVLELTEEVRRVSTEQVSATMLKIEAGPIAPALKPQLLQAPAGLRILERVVVGESRSSDEQRMLRVQVMLRQATPSSVRMVGRRIYLDFMALEGGPVADPAAVRPMPTVARAAVPRRPSAPEPYAVVMQVTTDRFYEIQPFLLSATSSAVPNPAVLQALAETIGVLHQSLQGARVPDEARPRFQMLVSAVDLAAEAVDADFRGDRRAKARQAIADLTAATGQLAERP
jgi:hypothetical protein